MTSKPPAQWKQMLAVLRERGPRGVHTFELRHMGIGNPSERHRELEAMGHVIDSRPEKFGPNKRRGVRYTLRHDAIVEQRRAAASTTAADEPAQLFAGVRIGRGQRSAIFDDDMGEAA